MKFLKYAVLIPFSSRVYVGHLVYVSHFDMKAILIKTFKIPFKILSL